MKSEFRGPSASHALNVASQCAHLSSRISMDSIPLPFIGRSVDPVCSPAAHDCGSGHSAQCLLQAIALLARQTRFENTFKLCLALDPWQIGELHDNVIGETAQQLGLRSSVPEAPGIVSGWPQPSLPSEPARPIAFLLSLLSSSVPPYGLIGRTSSSAPFRFSTVDNRHADEAQACRRRRVLERRPFWAKGCNPLTPA